MLVQRVNATDLTRQVGGHVDFTSDSVDSYSPDEYLLQMWPAISSNRSHVLARRVS